MKCKKLDIFNKSKTSNTRTQTILPKQATNTHHSQKKKASSERKQRRAKKFFKVLDWMLRELNVP